MTTNYASTKRNTNRQQRHKQKTINRINNAEFVYPIDFFCVLAKLCVYLITGTLLFCPIPENKNCDNLNDLFR